MNTGLIHQFNRYSGENKSLIRKALDSTTGVGGALIPQKLEQVITNTVVQLSAELAVVNPRFDNQKLHEFNQITALPSAGGAMGEGATTPTRQSAFTRQGVTLKVVRRKGAVTNYLQDASAKYVDASAAEMENHLLAHTYDLVYYMYHGNKGANAYEYDGWDAMVQTNRFDKASAVPTSLKFLDDMIDANRRKQGAKHKKAFMMSPEMLSKVSQLLTNVRLLQSNGAGGLSQVEVNGGWRLNAYRDIPIIESTSTRPVSTMTTVVGVGGTSGALSDGTYYVRVAPVTYFGEQAACPEVTVVLSGGTGTQSIDLSWTAFKGGNNDAISYRVYAGTMSGNLTLKAVIPAFTYDGTGTPTGDNVAYALASMTPVAASVNSAMENDKPLSFVGGVPEENVWLIDLDEYQGLGKLPYTNTAGSRFGGLVTIAPLAIVDDNIPFLIKSYCALVPAFEGTSALSRRLRVE